MHFKQISKKVFLINLTLGLFFSLHAFGGPYCASFLIGEPRAVGEPMVLEANDSLPPRNSVYSFTFESMSENNSSVVMRLLARANFRHELPREERQLNFAETLQERINPETNSVTKRIYPGEELKQTPFYYLRWSLKEVKEDGSVVFELGAATENRAEPHKTSLEALYDTIQRQYDERDAKKALEARQMRETIERAKRNGIPELVAEMNAERARRFKGAQEAVERRDWLLENAVAEVTIKENESLPEAPSGHKWILASVMQTSPLQGRYVLIKDTANQSQARAERPLSEFDKAQAEIDSAMREIDDAARDIERQAAEIRDTSKNGPNLLGRFGDMLGIYIGHPTRR
ncbi:MAG: hypothetical protein ACRBBP_08055 [Bdellovibrionales bacterium]